VVNSKKLELTLEIGQNRAMATSHLGIPALLLLSVFVLFSAALAQNPSQDVEATLKASEDKAAAIAFFENKIRPLFHDHCVACHGLEKQEGGLRLDTPEGIVLGGDSGAAVLPGSASGSLVVAAVRHVDSLLEMPPAPLPKLSSNQIADIERWIDTGAIMPAVEMEKQSPKEGGQSRRVDKSHWSFQAILRPALPELDVAGSQQVSNPIDLFILQEQVELGVKSNSASHKSDWLRRVTFDLTGLPPTVEEITNFLADQTPDANDRVIERLLASPRYGERWGRFWMDVVRYADSNGLDENIAHGTAWRYRNYIIDSLNADKPYDRFITEQVAGDLLPFETREQRNSQLTATAFLALGPKVLAEVDERKMEMDIVDEQIDTLGKAVLGMTFGCARCHDHKFDPVSTEDYYGLAGVFKSTHTMDSFTKIAKWHENQVASEEEEAELTAKQQEIEELKSRLSQLAADGATEGEKQSLTERIAALQKALPTLPTVMGVKEGTVQDVPVHVRGNHLVLASKVERRFPEVLAEEDKAITNEGQSGRLELASWMTSSRHPLTARVIANRVWRWHFGRGLVASTDNFGALGERPSHPELLDWLASELVHSGWSLKHLHRLIVRSSTYSQSGELNEEMLAKDPENRLLWRYPLRRLEAEAIRDFLLASCGQLDLARGTSLLHVGNREFLFDHTSIDRTKYDSHLRAVYLPVIRNHLYDLFDLFDYSDAATVQGDRGSTVVAPQALFMLNSGLVHEAADGLAKRVLSQTDWSDLQRVEHIVLSLYGRPATASECESMLRFVAQADAEHRAERWVHLCQAAIASNDFLFVR